MRLRVFATSLLTVGLLAGTALPPGDALAQAAGDVIAQRRAGLKRMGQHAEAIKGIVDGRGDVGPVVERADDMLAWFRQFPTLFPPGSDRGDTKAAPAVWTDRAGFEQASATIVARLEALRAAAQSGNQAATAGAFREVGQACGGCHRGFRLR
ncbi:cytochrome c [Roseomonas sp. NAR14]|uniref:Cytochrome c n=1 Tax=Roseomonas acroporae TaxID=2937791 RepID=A0A9X1YA57_9PROT|nr:cytochrome c [Roseomonas acroporae]MCK8786363.1 cytochrome c [Roseomonas acroporae]